MNPTQYAAIKAIGDPGKARVMMFTNGQPAHASLNSVAAGAIHGATAKATPIDADEFGYYDSVGAGPVKATWANIKATLKTYLDTLYQPLSAVLTALSGIGTAVAGDLIYGSGAGTWARLAKGTALQNLRINAAGTAPEWATAREVLTANRTYFVSTTGSDSNNGLSAGSPFLTIQKAFNVICTLDLNGFTVTVQLADGTYTSGLIFTQPWVGGNLVFQGNAVTPSNVLVSVTSANAISSSAPLSGIVTIQNMALQTTTAGTGILHNKSGLIQISNLVFNACVTAHIQCFGPGADILVTGNYSITAGSVRHFEAAEGGRITAASRTITLTGTPAFSFAFASGQRLGLLMAQSMTFSGAATGPYYNAANGGGVYTGGGGATYFPGSVAGTATSPGWYA